MVHVGGTNGKGSVCATVEAVLRARGHRVAMYTSPHLIDFRERIVIDNRPASEAAIVEFIREWTPTVERTGATFFEATTAMAFSLFASAEPDVAVVEVGLGGRLDATNVVDPAVAVVTAIGIDHVEYLGDTTEAIAREKAGIFKPRRPAVIGEPDAAVRVLLREAAEAAGAVPVRDVHAAMPVSEVRVEADGTHFVVSPGGERITCRTPLLGAHQAHNAATAFLTLEAMPEAFAVGAAEASQLLAGVALPGRFHRRGRYVFDVAHNPAGAAVFAATLRAVAPPRPRTAVLSVLGDKDWRGMIAALRGEIDLFVLTTAPTSPASRAWDPAAVFRVAQEEGWAAVLERDFDAALARAAAHEGTIVITGSFHTVGDAMARLHVSPRPD